VAVSVPAGLRARAGVSAEGVTAREIRIHGSGGALIPEGWQVADDGGVTAWTTDAGAIAFFDQPLYPGQTTEAGPLWPFGNFARFSWPSSAWCAGIALVGYLWSRVTFRRRA
jgi:hypothetical protein